MTKSNEKGIIQSCWNKAKEDELLFVLLERDESMADTIDFWIENRIQRGKNKFEDYQIQEALGVVDYLRRKHPEQNVKRT